MNIFRKITVFQILLASIMFPAFSMQSNFATFMQGGATEAQYPKFMQEFRHHYSEYIKKINSILEEREAHKKGPKTWKSEPISRKQILRLNSFLENMSDTVVLTAEIERARRAFNPHTKSFETQYREITGKDLIKGYQFHHIIPLELCGQKQTQYCTQMLNGNDPFNLIQLTAAEHLTLTNYISSLK